MTHDIIDNRDQKLVDHINRILDTADAGRFAVGYFFLSGLEGIGDHLQSIRELRLLIGNTTNRETLEQLAEGYRHLDLVNDAAEAMRYPRRPDKARMIDATAENIRSAVELTDQTDETERLVHLLVRLIQEGRLKVRVYTKGRLHAKAYIFDYPQPAHYEPGIAIVGSSNLTLAGVCHNTELNVVVHGSENHQRLCEWYEELWDESDDFDASLMEELQQSWAAAVVRPYDIYLKTLYCLLRDRLEGGDDHEILWDDEITNRLADFQKVAVRQAIRMIGDWGGCFVADVVGLGKSYIGAAIVKHFERTHRARPLIICPAPLVDMWERYNEVYQLNARVMSTGFLVERDGNPNWMEHETLYRDRDFVLIDESHALRHNDTQRYRVVEGFLRTGRRCCLLTATPRNRSSWDIYNQIKLFHQDDQTELPVDPPNLQKYFDLVEHGQRQLPDLLAHVLIRRTRNHILKWYGHDADTHERIDRARFAEYRDGKRRAYVMVAGRHQFFPKRDLRTLTYSIEDTYQGLYQKLRGYIGPANASNTANTQPNGLCYARYGLWHYVLPSCRNREPYASLHRAGANLRGLIRVMLFKRFESSVEAFRQTIRRMRVVHERFIAALDDGLIPAGEDAQQILYEPNAAEEQDILDALRRVSGRYDADDFDLPRLRDHVAHDLGILESILQAIEPITPDADAKLQTLIAELGRDPLSSGKRLIFTQYADTAQYLFDQLNPNSARDDIDVIYSGDRSKLRAVGRFSPGSNPEFTPQPGDVETNTLVATDVLAEGLNLQDCDKIVNYDLHWNPVRLIQRFGRIDRIGSEHDQIYGFNFLPETELERQLGLRATLQQRIREIHETIGEDSAILDPSEQLNEDAMYAIYEDQETPGEEGGPELLDLHEAEEFLRQLQRDDPEEFQLIVDLRDGIRTARPSSRSGAFVFCEASSPGVKGYQQLLVVDEQGNVVSRDVSQALRLVVCEPDLPGLALPTGYNRLISRVNAGFAQEVRHRQTEMEHTQSLSQAQRYVMRELRVCFGNTEDEEVKARINLFETVFRLPLTRALSRELNRLRSNGVNGQALLDALGQLYVQHNMREWEERQSRSLRVPPVPRVVCSEGLMDKRDDGG